MSVTGPASVRPKNAWLVPGKTFHASIGRDQNPAVAAERTAITFVVEVDGDEVFRSVQMPTTGPIDWGTLAAGHESSNGTSPDFSRPEIIQGATLVSGTNTLAIGVWNQTVGSTDLILVPQLTIKTSADNCPLVPNPDQADTDGDGHGDACDL